MNKCICRSGFSRELFAVVYPNQQLGAEAPPTGIVR